MRKKNFWLLSLLLALTACSQQENLDSTEQGTVNYRMSVGVDNGIKTRADNEYPNPDLASAYRPRYTIEIYNNNILYKRLVQTSNVADFRLITNQAYDFLIWVDYVTLESSETDLHDLHYDTSNLKAVSLIGNYVNNDQSRDAFFYAFSKTAEEIGNQANNFSIICQRPFGQLNVSASDWLYSNNVATTPETLNISFTAYSQFNVLTGEVSNPVTTPLTYTINESTIGKSQPNDNFTKLTCDYILAPTAGTYVIPNTVITFFNADGNKVTDTGAMLFNLPIKRNFKTNVSGMLLSKSGSVTVDVAPAWNTPSIDLTDTVQP